MYSIIAFIVGYQKNMHEIVAGLNIDPACTTYDATPSDQARFEVKLVLWIETGQPACSVGVIESCSGDRAGNEFSGDNLETAKYFWLQTTVERRNKNSSADPRLVDSRLTNIHEVKRCR